MTIATIAANVAAALVNVTTATDAASTVKFDALVDFAAGAALRLRVEHINKGSNLETDGKGRIVAFLDITKQQRAALVTAFEGVGVGEKDAANIASMGRTVALHFVPLMIADGSLSQAKSGDRIAEIIRESLLKVTGEAATYNAVEKARSRKWAVAEVEAEAPMGEGEADPTDAIDMSATLDSAPVQEEGASEASAAETMEAEVSGAIRALFAAMERDDPYLAMHGFRALLTEGLSYVQRTEKAEKEAEKALKAA